MILGSLTLASLLFLGLMLSLVLAQNSLARITTASDSNRNSSVPNISADGTKIVFSSDSDFLGQGIADNHREFWLYDTAMMTVTRITTKSHSNRQHYGAPLNADGTKIVFFSDSDFLGQSIADEQYEVWLFDTATMTLTRITTASNSTERDSYVGNLTSDGTKIALRSDSDFLGQGIADDQSEIWLYDTTAMTVTRITTASDSSRKSSGPNISADGTKIVFSSNSDFLGQGIPVSQSEIWLYDTATMTVTRITTASHSNRTSFGPSINADGTRIAFGSNSDFFGQGIALMQYEIWLYDTATMTLTRITTATHSNVPVSDTPQINGDGTKIVFFGNSDLLGQGIPSNQFEVWLYDTTTMTHTRITTSSDSPNRSSSSPSISADGTKIAFQSDSDFLGQGIADNQGEIWLYDASIGGESKTYLPLIIKD